jgi:hypothetical protein
LFTQGGAIIDLATVGIVHQPWGYAEWVEDGRLMLSRDGRIRAVDLTTFAVEETPAFGKWLLPPVHSPLSTRSASNHDNAIQLHEPGRPTRTLASGLVVELRADSEMRPDRPPLLWLDEGRILTQRWNGVLILVTVNGEEHHLLDVRLTDEERRPRYRPRLVRDRAGDIIYDCHNLFRINPVDREWGRYERRPLGHDFFLDVWYEEGHQAGLGVWHGGRQIGRTARPYWDASCEGHLALSNPPSLLHPEGRDGLPGGIRVWSQDAGWADITIGTSCLLGWVDHRPPPERGAR